LEISLFFFFGSFELTQDLSLPWNFFLRGDEHKLRK